MKKLISALIAVSAITSIGLALDANAASITSSKISVCSRNMTHNGCLIDRSTTITVPKTGKYSVIGLVGRGTHNDECQAREDFDLYIDGRFYATSIDDNSCEPGHNDVWKKHNFPEVKLSKGTHTIRMIHRLWNKPWTGTAESVGVSLEFTLMNQVTIVDGVCGNANGKVFTSKPTVGLCNVNVGSKDGSINVSGNGPWNWICRGGKGGKTVSCSADKKAVNATCGTRAKIYPSNSTNWSHLSSWCGNGFDVHFYDSVGFPVSGQTKKWRCEGISGGANIECSATKVSKCGTNNNKQFTNIHTQANNTFCDGVSVPQWSDRQAQDGIWNWNCGNISCEANKIEIPVCGSANGQTSEVKPTIGLCSVGTASNINGNGPWDWNCTSGTRTTSCSSNIVAAPICGASHNKKFSSLPTLELCTVGNPSPVIGNGPWTWSCVNGVRNISCNAHYAKTAIKITKTNGNDSGDSQTIETGADASFTITVTNIGEENLSNIVINDEKASQCNRNASQTEALYEGSLLDPGESFTYICSDTNVKNSYTNIADVTANATTSDIIITDSDPSDIVVNDPETPVTPEPTPVTPEPTPVTPEPTPVTPEPTPEIEEKEDDDGAIGNFVWHDRNKNGIQDPGEEGIAGVKIKLYNGNEVKTDKTNSRGRYKFKELDPGQYKIVVAEETLPTGCYQTYDKDGKLDNKIKTRIEGDEYYRKADFGYYCPSNATVAQMSPQTGAGAVAGGVSLIAAALAAGFVQRRNIKQNI